MESYLRNGEWMSLLGQLQVLINRSQDALYQTSEMALHSKISSLLLLAERITDEASRCKKKAVEVQRQSNGKVSFAAVLSLEDPFFALEADTESFYYFVVSILDITAKIAAILLDPTSVHLKDRTRLYFSNQRQWLVKHWTLDPDYSDYLDKHMMWTERLETDRNSLAHELAAFVNVDTTKVTIKLYSANVNRSNIIDEIDTHVKEVMTNMYDYLSLYAKHFA